MRVPGKQGEGNPQEGKSHAHMYQGMNMFPETPGGMDDDMWDDLNFEDFMEMMPPDDYDDYSGYNYPYPGSYPYNTQYPGYPAANPAISAGKQPPIVGKATKQAPSAGKQPPMGKKTTNQAPSTGKQALAIEHIANSTSNGGKQLPLASKHFGGKIIQVEPVSSATSEIQTNASLTTTTNAANATQVVATKPIQTTSSMVVTPRIVQTKSDLPVVTMGTLPLVTKPIVHSSAQGFDVLLTGQSVTRSDTQQTMIFNVPNSNSSVETVSQPIENYTIVPIAGDQSINNLSVTSVSSLDSSTSRSRDISPAPQPYITAIDSVQQNIDANALSVPLPVQVLGNQLMVESEALDDQSSRPPKKRSRKSHHDQQEAVPIMIKPESDKSVLSKSRKRAKPNNSLLSEKLPELGIDEDQLYKEAESKPIRHRIEPDVDSAKSRSTRNAINARVNREKHRIYVTKLEEDNEKLKEENRQLLAQNSSLENSRLDLEKEIVYLRRVLANESSLGNVLSGLNNVSNVRLSSSVLGKYKHQADSSDDPINKQTSKDLQVNKVTGGICLHVDRQNVSIEFCSKCAELAAHNSEVDK